MPLSIVRQDITHMKVDAIVNAANERLIMGGGVCGAIFRAAGEEQMKAACAKIGHVACGSAVATPGFALQARWVIHTAGPRWDAMPGPGSRKRQLLSGCYMSSLDLAGKLGATSIAFPLISSGIFGCPKSLALEIATEAIRSWLTEEAKAKPDAPDMFVYLCVFGHDATKAARKLDRDLEEYIGETYVDEAMQKDRRSRRRELELLDEDTSSGGVPLSASAPMPSAHEATPEDELDDLLRNLDASFPETLLSMIDARGMTDAEVYNRANLTRQYFSKLRSGKIHPSKRVVLALAVALGLDLDQTELLLGRAGYSLAHNSKFDVIVEFYIGHGICEIDEINYALFKHDQQLLGVA